MNNTLKLFYTFALLAGLVWLPNHCQAGPSMPPTPAAMHALGERVASGDQAAFRELQEVKRLLYSNIENGLGRETIVANLILMKAAFDVVGEQAGQGNEHAFEALKTCLIISNQLASFAPDALGLAAAAGHQPALEILLHYNQWNIGLATAVFALRPAAANNKEAAVDFLIGIMEDLNAKALWYGAAEGLAGAAAKGNLKAQVILQRHAETKGQ